MLVQEITHKGESSLQLLRIVLNLLCPGMFSGFFKLGGTAGTKNKASGGHGETEWLIRHKYSVEN